jgi:predicted enzyme related to lactoylglutathione lyase
MASVTFFEISGPDVAKLRDFYVDGVGLELDPQTPPEPAPYVQFASGDGAIPGGLHDGGGVFESPGLTYAVPYVQVDDVDAAVERAVQAGGTVVASARQHGPTRSAHLLDPAGNRFGIYTFVEPQS